VGYEGYLDTGRCGGYAEAGVRVAFVVLGTGCQDCNLI
jgi:hypothetical protein